MNYVFVYGTLKAGFHNHHFLNGAPLVAATKTSGAYYTMLNIGAFPMVIAGQSRISGELYSVDDATLAIIDHVEGNGVMLTRYHTEIEHTGVDNVWMYQGDDCSMGDTVFDAIDPAPDNTIHWR